MKINRTREKILSYFACKIGGWNAEKGKHTGNLINSTINYQNDEEVVNFLLDTYKNDIETPLKEEIKELKVKIYDLSLDKIVKKE